MPDVADRFKAEHFTLNSISPARREHVALGLRRLGEFLDKPIEEATANDLREWLVALLDEGLKPSTADWYLRIAKMFYRWCWNTELIDAERYMRIREVRPPRGARNYQPRPYSRKELRQMWAELDARWPYNTNARSLKRWRNGTSRFRNVKKHAMRLQLDAMIELALVCGLRSIEIYRLSIDECHWDNKYIVVHGKRVDQHDKVREVPYPDSTRKAVYEWVRMRRLMKPAPDAPLWLSITGPEPTSALRPERMETILRSFGNWHLHRLRHTCATERLRAGMDLEKLQRFLGHASIKQTLAYAKLVRSDIHKASERIDADFQRAIKPAA